jgi:hypothetical protein
MEPPVEATEMNGSENQRLRREEILRRDLESAQLKWEMIEVDIQEKEDKIWAVTETNWKDRKAAERAQRERIESEARKAIEEEHAAHEKERAVLAAFKQTEADNKMCSCPFASWSPHRYFYSLDSTYNIISCIPKAQPIHHRPSLSSRNMLTRWRCLRIC